MKKTAFGFLALIMIFGLFASFPFSVEGASDGSNGLTSERYEVNWTIPELEAGSVATGGSAGSESILEYLSYEILGYTSPKYSDDFTSETVEGSGVITAGELNDGTVGSNHFLNDPWVGLYGNEQNAVIIDLGAYYTNVSTIEFCMLSDPDNGIFLPSSIEIGGSADGASYIKLAEIEEGSVDSHFGMIDVTAGATAENYAVPNVKDADTSDDGSTVYKVNYSPSNVFGSQYIILVFNHADGSDGFGRYWTFLSEIDVKTGGAVVIPDSPSAYSSYTDKLAGDVYTTNVAKNSNYRILGSTMSGDLADTGRIQLTDGLKGSGDTSSRLYVGIDTQNADVAIIVDLGAVKSNITGFNLPFIAAVAGSVGLPGGLSISVSNDNLSWSSISFTTSDNCSASVSNNKAVSARYVMFRITPSAQYLNLDEVEIFTTSASFDKENLAGKAGATYKYFNKEINISFNDDKWGGAKTNGVPSLGVYGAGDLNDGIFSTATYFDPAWVGFNYVAVPGDYVEIVFDLGDMYDSINGVNFRVLEYTSGSSTEICSVPSEFTVYFSSDEVFTASKSAVGAENTGVMLTLNSQPTAKFVYHTYSATLNNVNARYIKLKIPKTNKELFIDEVEIWHGNRESATPPPVTYEPMNYKKVSGVWLSCFDVSPLYLYQGTYQVDEQTYRTRLGNYLTAMENAGINTIYLHARSHGDNLYGDYSDSFLYPTSRRASGSYYTKFAYDVFEIFLAEAHAKGISVQAWINPLRLMTASEILTIDNSYEIKKFYNGDYSTSDGLNLVGLVEGTYWLNIGYSRVRDLIVNGVAEIIDNYDVDGIHLDDYFYPAGATTAFDSDCYSRYLDGAGADPMSLPNWRRDNTNTLVSALYSTVKAKDPDLIFGISPFGNNIASGYEAGYNYNTMYADVKMWCANSGYIDYIAPQLYWGFTSTSGAEFGSGGQNSTTSNDETIIGTPTIEYSNPSGNYQTGDTRTTTSTIEYSFTTTTTSAYTGLVADWAGIPYHNSVELIIGLGLYRSGGDLSTQPQIVEYTNNNVVLAQVEFLRNNFNAAQSNGGTTIVTNKEYKDKVVIETATKRGSRVTWREVSTTYSEAYDFVEGEPVVTSGSALVPVDGLILYNSGSLYNDFSSPNGYFTGTYFSAARSLALRNELSSYWQGQLGGASYLK